MSQYSIGGYVASQAMRTSRTIFVEGSDDKELIDRVLFEFGSIGALKNSVLVDSAEIIKSPANSIVGNREKVSLLHREAQHKKLSNIVFFEDREFREFDTVTISDRLNCHKCSDGLFWTRGHSIENYFFELECICRFLELFYSAFLSFNYKQLLALHLPVIIDWAVAISLSSFDLKLINRMKGLFDRSTWVFTPLGLSIDLKALNAGLLKRNELNQFLKI